MNRGYLLDTNIPSETLRLSPAAKLAAWLESHAKDSQFLSVVTLGELRWGITLLAPGGRRTQLENFIEVTVPLWFADRVLPDASHCRTLGRARWPTSSRRPAPECA